MSDETRRALDVVLDAPASVSVYVAALEHAGRRQEANTALVVHRRAAVAAAGALRRTALWSVTAEADAAAPHRHEQVDADVEIVVHGLGAGADLHAHLIVDGDVDLYVESARRAAPVVQRCYDRCLMDGLAAELGLSVSTANDVDQIAGVPTDVLDQIELVPCRTRAGASQVRLSPRRP